ncbi:MAG TPA: glycosyltransferase [Terriglobia bacterium]|nr:glycosyltransferase [Terriglobia bacterium]
MPESLKELRVALVHYWLVSHRGGERVVEVLGDMFPQADIFTLVYDPGQTSERIRRHRIHTSFLQSIPLARRAYRSLLPLMPMALEQFDLRAYDLVISQESGPAHGVLTSPETCHICYCHTPMRYAWNMYQEYWQGAGRLKRLLIPPMMNRIRNWDQLSAARVDYFVASSKNGARRIRKYYRREAPVIYPPVDLLSFSIGSHPEDFYLVISPLVAYKRVDLAVAACSKLNRRLVVIGSGAELPRLRQMAGPSVTFLGSQTDEVVRDHYRRCRAFLFPGEEDIGLTPIEAQASGKPVIAYAKGGALETVVGYQPAGCSAPGAGGCTEEQEVREDPDTCTGVFFQSQTAEELLEAMQLFESIEARFNPAFIRSHVERFAVSRFKNEMSAFIACKMSELRRSSSRAQAGGSAFVHET